MRHIITTLLLLLSLATLAQKSTLEILKDQVAAFNAADIERLTSNISEDFKWYYIGTDTLLLEVEGREQFKKSMESYFGYVKNVQTKIAEYAIEGDKISFKEVVEYDTPSGERKSASAMAIYQMKDGLIYRVWYFF